MTTLHFLKLFGAGLLVLLALDLIWLGVVAKGFYQEQLASLMRPDVQWLPAVLFYLIYVAAVVAIVVVPAVEQQSLGRAVLYGALFGLAAYSAYDLTSLALIRDFPTKVAIVDLIWGTFLTASVSAAAYLAS